MCIHRTINVRYYQPLMLNVAVRGADSQVILVNRSYGQFTRYNQREGYYDTRINPCAIRVNV